MGSGVGCRLICANDTLEAHTTAARKAKSRGARWFMITLHSQTFQSACHQARQPKASAALRHSCAPVAQGSAPAALLLAPIAGQPLPRIVEPAGATVPLRLLVPDDAADL